MTSQEIKDAIRWIEEALWSIEGATATFHPEDKLYYKTCFKVHSDHAIRAIEDLKVMLLKS